MRLNVSSIHFRNAREGRREAMAVWNVNLHDDPDDPNPLWATRQAADIPTTTLLCPCYLFCILSHLVLTVAFTLFGQLHVTALYFLVFVWICFFFQSCHDGHDEAYDESTGYGREEASSLHGPQ